MLEHREDDVAAAAGQADHGGVVVLALGALAIVVGLGVRVRVRGDPGGVEQRVFQPLVARACAPRIEVPDLRVTGAIPA